MILARVLPYLPRFYKRHSRVVDASTDCHLPRLILLMACVLVRFCMLTALVFQALALLFLGRLLILMLFIPNGTLSW